MILSKAAYRIIIGRLTTRCAAFLCSDAEMSDPSAAAFWQPRDPGALVDQALALLRAIDFGLVEDLQSTLCLATARLGYQVQLGRISL